MRLGPDDPCWLVTDPTPTSELADVWTETSLRDLARLFAGGLILDRHPTLFTDRAEAKIEAFGRLTALRAARAIAQHLAARGGVADAPHRLEILNGEGQVVFSAELPSKEDPDASAR